MDQLVCFLGQLNSFTGYHFWDSNYHFPSCIYGLCYLVNVYSLSGGHVVGNFSPHEAFAIGGTNSVRGYEEGAVGSGRSYVVGSGETSFPVV